MTTNILTKEINKDEFAIKFQVHRAINNFSKTDVADKLELTELDITALENGQFELTDDLIKKSAVIFKTDISNLLSSSSSINNFEHVYSSPINSTFHTFKTVDDKQNEAILLLIDNVTSMNKRITELLDQK